MASLARDVLSPPPIADRSTPGAGPAVEKGASLYEQGTRAGAACRALSLCRTDESQAGSRSRMRHSLLPRRDPTALPAPQPGKW